MISLLIALGTILIVYIILMLIIMKRFMPWRYKALIYGSLTFFMLVGVFLTFASYDKYWK